MPAAWEYEQAVNNVSNWFNTSADNVWANINQYNLTPEQVQGILPTVDSFLYGQGTNSGYTAVKAADGSVLSWNNVAGLQGNSANAVEQAVNSNAGAITQQTYQLPANTDYGGTGGTFSGTKGVTGGGSTVKVMSQVSAGVAAAGLGIKLGKAIDSALYNLNPDFWDNNGMSSLNPETWNSITADMSDSGWEGTLKRAFNAIYGLDPNTGKSQMYLDADAAAYLAMYMQEKGVFSSGEETVTTDELTFNTYQPPYTVGGTPEFHYTYRGQRRNAVYTPNDRSHFVSFINPAHDHGLIIGASATQGATLYVLQEQSGSFNPTYTTITTEESATYNGKTVYFAARNHSIPDGYTDLVSSGWGNEVNNIVTTEKGKIAWCLVYGTHTSSPTIAGISDQDNATLPNFSGCETPADYKQALQQQYPEMFQNPITQNVAQPDGTVTQKVYIPVGTPTATGTQDTQPVTDPQNTGQSQSQTEVDPQAATQTIIETITKYIENLRTPDTPDTPNPPDTGDGNTPQRAC